MVNSRNKGARIEREAAKALAAVTGLPHERGARNGVPGADDCVGWPGVHEEVKGRKKIAALRWLDQSIADAGDDLPIVVMKEDRGEFVLMVRLSDLPRLAERYAKATGKPVYPSELRHDQD